MYARVNGIRIAYSDRGGERSPVLLLVHGFPLDRRFWAGQLRSLSSVARVIAPDLRGHGRSDVPPGPYTMEQHADDLAALLDHLGIRRAIVAGLSMGGYIAFAFWRRHPQRIQALVLLDTKAAPDTEDGKAARDAAAARVQAIGTERFADEMLPRMLAPESLADQRLANRALRIMADQSVSGILGALPGLRDRPDSRPTLSTITVPTLVVVGEADVLTPLADAQAMASAISRAQLAVVPHAGHLSPLEKPRAVNAVLREFIRQVAEQT